MRCRQAGVQAGKPAPGHKTLQSGRLLQSKVNCFQPPSIYECQGFAAAHAKAAEMRMAAYKNVTMSVSNPDESPTDPPAA
jgi:hypothetical protein